MAKSEPVTDKEVQQLSNRYVKISTADLTFPWQSMHSTDIVCKAGYGPKESPNKIQRKQEDFSLRPRVRSELIMP